jgi:hypothetical protein
MPKRSLRSVAEVTAELVKAISYGPKAMGHQVPDGRIVICDPDAPIENDCHVLWVCKGDRWAVSDQATEQGEVRHRNFSDFPRRARQPNLGLPDGRAEA